MILFIVYASCDECVTDFLALFVLFLHFCLSCFAVLFLFLSVLYSVYDINHKYRTVLFFIGLRLTARDKVSVWVGRQYKHLCNKQMGRLFRQSIRL